MKDEREHRNLLLGIIFLSVFIFQFSICLAHNDSIFMGTQVKLDIASPILIPAVNHWKVQHYEAAVNVRLAKRFYPTFELGYAGGSTDKGDTIFYNGHGGFFRLGCDLNPLKRHPEAPHALLVGIRFGTSVQGANGVYLEANGQMKEIKLWEKVTADCWGEIVAGCQVEVAQVQNTAFYMGWMGRFKILFTRSKGGKNAEELKDIYIPGFGQRDNTAWGVNYYLGWRF